MKAYLSIKRIFLFTVLLLGSSVGRCQIYKYIGLEDGLSNQKIYHIQKDRRGYMWFLTQEGIDRYDGKRIKHYNFSDDSMKLDSRIALNWLYMDSKDVLWVIGQKGRVFQYDSQHDIEEAKRKLPFPIDIKARNFYESQIRQLIKKHFYNVSDESKFEHFCTLHDFSQGQVEEFMCIIMKIKESKSSFENLINKYTKAKAELYTIEKNIREAEKKAESDYVQNLRTRKENIDRQIDSIGEEIGKKQSEIETLKDQVIAHKKQKEILSKKINVSDQNRAVDNEATRLIHTIQKFLIRFKEEKKKALAKKLEAKLQSYLHKTNLVKKVIVDINGNGDDVDICLFGYDDKKIDNSILSMGERQMFASALLSALVDETEIEFPVFIDSPMQKFDPQHTKNVLTKFYPNVSKQVILFPLLKKELTEEEYQYIQPIVNKSYLINNEKDGSHFVEVKPENLFEEYNNSGYAN